MYIDQFMLQLDCFLGITFRFRQGGGDGFELAGNLKSQNFKIKVDNTANFRYPSVCISNRILTAGRHPKNRWICINIVGLSP
jgi:hypothetical protein